MTIALATQIAMPLKVITIQEARKLSATIINENSKCKRDAGI
jgi:hypothetical protein